MSVTTSMCTTHISINLLLTILKKECVHFYTGQMQGYENSFIKIKWL